MFLRWWDWWRQHESGDLVGLDIGSDYLKLLKINSSKSPFLVECFAVHQLPAGAMNSGEIKDQGIIINSLKNVFNQSGVECKDVALSIPRSLVIIKNVSVDKRLSPKEIESRAWIEANRHFPELVGNIYLDFSVLGPSTKDPSQLELMLVACRKEHIKSYQDVLRAASLVPKVIDVNSYALARELCQINNHSSHETAAVLNLDYTLSSLVVVHKEDLVYAQDQSFDGRRLKTQVQAYLEANKEKPLADTEIVNDEKYNNILKETLSSFLRQAMHFFYSSKPGLSIQQMVLAGDCANIAGLTSFIQREIGVETVVANPFVNMKLGKNINQEVLKEYGPCLTLCSGVALSRKITG